jgi:hypothetical protein
MRFKPDIPVRKPGIIASRRFIKRPIPAVFIVNHKISGGIVFDGKKILPCFRRGFFVVFRIRIGAKVEIQIQKLEYP